MIIRILVILILVYNTIFAIDFEVSAGGNISLGYMLNLSSANGGEVSGSKIGNGINANVLVGIGHNYRVSKDNVIRTVSVLLETGYNYYSRSRETFDFSYHSLLLGILPKMNFHNDLSFGIGGGVLFPLAGGINEPDASLGAFGELKKFTYDDIKTMHKLPIMPYVKATVEKYFYLQDTLAIKIDAIVLYNFGMSLDPKKLALEASKSPIYSSYNFSGLSVDVGLSVSFGRPRE